MIFFIVRFQFPFPAENTQKRNQQNHSRRDCGAKNDIMYIFFSPVRGVFHLYRLFLRYFIGNPHTPHQKPMAIDAIGRTGKQGHIIRIGINGDFPGFGRQDRLNLVYLISEDFSQHMKIEDIAFLQLIQIRKQFLPIQT